MTTAVSGLQNFRGERWRSLVLPREHGAWGILLVPLATGAGMGFTAGRGIIPLILFIAASLSLFCLRTPLEVRLGVSPLREQTPSERMAVQYSSLSYFTVAVLSLAWLLGREHLYGLLIIGSGSGLLFAAQAALKRLGRRTRMAAQFVGALGLTSTAPGAYYVVTGRLDQQALVLWVVNWLFAANQIHFVQVRIHGVRAATFGEKLRAGKWLLVAELGAACLLFGAWHVHFLPGLAVLAFIPVLVRGIWWFGRANSPLAIRQLGLSELAHALAFGVLFIVSLHL